MKIYYFHSLPGIKCEITMLEDPRFFSPLFEAVHPFSLPDESITFSLKK